MKLVGRVRQHGIANKAYDLPSRGNRVGKSRGIDFEVRSTSVAGAFELYWKVRNYGAEALGMHALRGEVTRAAPGVLTRYETTSYRGSHYVEVLRSEERCVCGQRPPGDSRHALRP